MFRPRLQATWSERPGPVGLTLTPKAMRGPSNLLFNSELKVFPLDPFKALMLFDRSDLYRAVSGLITKGGFVTTGTGHVLPPFVVRMLL
jgi:hypothetical protein